MTGLDLAIAAFAIFMVFRHGPRAARLLRGEGPRSMALVSLLNVVLAVVIFAVAVKGLLGGLISR
jgi:hypothetical protein